MKQFLLLLAVYSTLVSCISHNDAIVVTQFISSGDTLKHKLLLHADSLYAFPLNFAVIDDYAVVCNHGQGPVLSIYSLPEWKLIKHYGAFGNGPKDFHAMEPSMMNPTDYGFQTFFVFRNELVSVKLDSTGVEIIKKENMPLETIMTRGMSKINNSTYFFQKNNDRSEYFFYDASTSKIIKGPEYATDWLKEEVTRGTHYFTFTCYSTAKPDKSKFAIFYQHFKRIRIYDSEKLNIDSDIKVQTEPHESTYDHRNNYINARYYSIPQSTDDAIYVLCQNMNIDTPFKNTELQIWKWDGTPYASYVLDRPSKYIAISEKHNKIYCIDINNHVIEYELPKVL